MSYRSEALNDLQTELNRTGVISDSWRGTLMSYALAAHKDGYNDGIEEGKRRLRRILMDTEAFREAMDRLNNDSDAHSDVALVEQLAAVILSA